jgi:ribosomal-protein-serine acetyltransferase
LELTPPPLDVPRLRLATDADAEEIAALIERSRPALAEFMPWAAGSDLEAVREFRRRAERERQAGEAIHTVIEVDGRIAGSVGAHHIDEANGACELGYWLGDGYTGRGLVTAAVRAFLDHAFGTWGLRRVAILAATDNVRSRAIPERLGFRQEGVLRQAEVVGDRVHDLVVYSLLRDEHGRSAHLAGRDAP